jgi:hypothetical protein
MNFVGDVDEQACLEASVGSYLGLQTRTKFVAGSDGTYQSCQTELWHPKRRDWVPFTNENIGDVLKGER